MEGDVKRKANRTSMIFLALWVHFEEEEDLGLRDALYGQMRWALLATEKMR